MKQKRKCPDKLDIATEGEIWKTRQKFYIMAL